MGTSSSVPSQPDTGVPGQSDLQDDVLLQLDKMEQLVSKGSGPPETSRRYASCIHRRWQGIWLTACSKGCQQGHIRQPLAVA